MGAVEGAVGPVVASLTLMHHFELVSAQAVHANTLSQSELVEAGVNRGSGLDLQFNGQAGNGDVFHVEDLGHPNLVTGMVRSRIPRTAFHGFFLCHEGISFNL